MWKGAAAREVKKGRRGGIFLFSIIILKNKDSRASYCRETREMSSLSSKLKPLPLFTEKEFCNYVQIYTQFQVEPLSSTTPIAKPTVGLFDALPTFFPAFDLTIHLMRCFPVRRY